MKLSVIIPSYNRLSTLKLCLYHLGQQSLAKDLFEVIVINDGSNEDYKKEIEDCFEKYKLSGLYHYQSNAGPARARNKGIDLSREDIVLFIGDDMLAEHDLLQRHRDFHLNNANDNQALLGKVEWSNKIKVNDFMKWLDTNDIQFDFKCLDEGKSVSYVHFYTSNISLKKRFLLHHGRFNESFPYAAFEDTELGYRLFQKGLNISYQPQALIYHHHYITFASYRNRMNKAKYSMKILVGLHPKLKIQFIAPKGFKKTAKKIIKTIIYMLTYPAAKLLNNKKILELCWQYKLLS